MSATLGVSALGLATEPVQQTLALGQVNLLLMLLVVADLLTAGALTPEGRTRWCHGTCSCPTCRSRRATSATVLILADPQFAGRLSL